MGGGAGVDQVNCKYIFLCALQCMSSGFEARCTTT